MEQRWDDTDEGKPRLGYKPDPVAGPYLKENTTLHHYKVQLVNAA
jgi:hypothetical protein